MSFVTVLTYTNSASNYIYLIFKYNMENKQIAIETFSQKIQSS